MAKKTIESLSNRALQKAMRRASDKRFTDRKCDWNSPRDVAEYRRLRNQHQREELLDKLVPQRRCPSCGRQYLKNISWVLSHDSTSVLCRGCNAVCSSKKGKAIFTKVVRYELDHNWLTNLRGDNSAQFIANRCGWSRARQTQLESGSVDSVSEDVRNKLKEILGMDMKPFVRFHIRYLKRGRATRGISAPAFAEKMGWSKSYQYQLESKTAFTVSEAVGNTMLELLGSDSVERVDLQ